MTWQLTNKLPIIGELLRNQALDSLYTYAKLGNPDAAEVLLTTCARMPEERLQKTCEDLFKTRLPQRVLNIAWQLWASNRLTWLEDSLILQGKPATQPIGTRVFSLLKLGSKQIEKLWTLPPDGIPTLSLALTDKDDEIRTNARKAIPGLSNIESINRLSEIWLRSGRADLLDLLSKVSKSPTRLPEAVFLALHAQLNDRLADAPPEWLRVICLCLCDSDSGLSAQASIVLRHFQREETIQLLCQTWHMFRVPELESAIVDARYLPLHPMDSRIYVALLTDRIDICRDAPPTSVRTLVDAIEDKNERIKINARDALLHLTSPESREMVFQAFIDTGSQNLKAIIIEAGFHPSSPGMQALYYFLSEQYDLYDTIDFDHRLLQIAYRSAEPELRQKIARLIQQTGRQDYLDILNQPQFGSNSYQPEEADLWIQIYSSHGDWQQLWDRSCEVPYSKSIQIIQLLKTSGWEPTSETEIPVFRQLCELAQQPSVNPEDIHKLIPCAFPIEYLNVRNRVNSVAFSPLSPEVAMATGNRKIILWDYRQGSLKRVISGFNHTIGSVSYLPDSVILAAERSNRSMPCSIYSIDGEGVTVIGGHGGAVTGIAMIGADRLITSGRDKKLNLWNIYNRRLIESRQLIDWARTITYQPVGIFLIACHKYCEVLDASQLSSPPMIINPDALSSVHSSSIRVMAPVPDSRTIILGKNNGQVAKMDFDVGRKVAGISPLYKHDRAVTGIAWRKSPHLSLLTASSEGRIIHYDWEFQFQTSFALSASDQLTSLVISPDERYLATGTSNGNMILWDLAPLDLPGIMHKPLAQCSVQTLQELIDLSLIPQLPPEIRFILEFHILQLRRRFQYDIELSENHGMVPGTFDILVD